MCHFLTRAIATILASAVVFVTGAAQAGTGQCYDRNGRPIGPTYNTDRPNASFNQWVARTGGQCRRVGDTFFGSNNRPYPEAYLNRGRMRPQRHGRAGCSRADLARLAPNIDRRHAERLVRRDFRRQGFYRARVRNSGLVIYVRGRLWQYLRVRTSDGARHQVALRQNRRGGYVALMNTGGGWGRRRYVGR
jgi:hypothetical protein